MEWENTRESCKSTVFLAVGSTEFNTIIDEKEIEGKL